MSSKACLIIGQCNYGLRLTYRICYRRIAHFVGIRLIIKLIRSFSYELCVSAKPMSVLRSDLQQSPDSYAFTYIRLPHFKDSLNGSRALLDLVFIILVMLYTASYFADHAYYLMAKSPSIV